ncbi:MAG TPA: class I SAM-dependent methyltransferase [Thermoanaerobaculia bacterium]|nr:class I SAM-dependent methyltransferase [Thermoanaerobaculia bacterium]
MSGRSSILYPRFDHPAIEERYASWQTQMLLRAGGGELFFYDPEEPASLAAADVESDDVLVVTDPLVVPPINLAARLSDVLDATGAAAAVPVSNVAQYEKQLRLPPSQYLTLRELQDVVADMQKRTDDIEKMKWDRSDPAIYLCPTAFLEEADDVPRRALAGLEVAISANDYVHRWSSLRGQARLDLLARIGTDAKSILEFGCGEAPLGEALKKRQKCRVVGIELDQRAAAIARKRIDNVFCGDVREIVALIREKFDWIIGGDIVEHLDEPWSFLSDLRKIAAPGGKLLLSLPNVANASVINDLLHGRFDYVYMGLTCVGHLRFFTKRTIEEMLTIAGWEVVSIEPQEVVSTNGRDDLLRALDHVRYAYSKDDVLPSGYYVTAQNPV